MLIMFIASYQTIELNSFAGSATAAAAGMSREQARE
jgi:hypothetical protein